MYCEKCGKQMSEREEILGDGFLHIIGSCFECNIQKDMGVVVEGGVIQKDNIPVNNVYNQAAPMYNVQQGNVKLKKKDSVLSTIACAFSFVSFFIPMILAILFVIAAFIIAVIDLAINEEGKKHKGSWVALVFCIIIALLIWGKFN